ncbi:unnamed protein product, partial [Chrysoparadoxa australica]
EIGFEVWNWPRPPVHRALTRGRARAKEQKPQHGLCDATPAPPGGRRLRLPPHAEDRPLHAHRSPLHETACTSLPCPDHPAGKRASHERGKRWCCRGNAITEGVGERGS